MSAFCPDCGAKLEKISNFCPDCGSKISKAKKTSSLTPRKLISVAILAVGLFLFAWYTQSALAGKKPKKEFSAAEHGAEQSFPQDTELEEMRKLAKSNPSDIALQKSYAAMIIERIRQSEQTSPALAFEAIDVLRNILNIDEQNADALIAMADLSFDQQAFAKAVEFYKRYLDIETNDLNARSRYASSLTFLGQFEQALSELNFVLQKDPLNFHAKAYLAITYAQMGDFGQARSKGEEAMRLAPSEEAKARFSQFLETLDKEEPSLPQGNKDIAYQPIIEHLKNNPIAGPKFKSYQITDTGDLVLLFQNFPMQNMPPVVREKFIKGIKDVAEGTQTEKPFKVIFREVSTSLDIDFIEVK